MADATDERHVQYWAISVLSSRTVQVNVVFFVVAALSLTQVVALVPVEWMPAYDAGVAVINLLLRFCTVRPVALIAPGTTKPVAVRMIGTPPPVVD